MLKVSPIIRLTIGLLLLTISLLLVGDMLGLSPDPKNAEMRARKAISESLAIQVSNNLADGHTGVVKETILRVQERNDQVLSVALRDIGGRLIVMAGDHSRHWDPPGENRSTTSHVQVPIHGDIGRWGVLEVSFKPLDSLVYMLLKGGSIATIVLFVTVFGFFAYWLFLKRALNELDPSSVVPDRVSTALDVLAEGLVLLDRRGRIVLANEAFQSKIGSSAQNLIGQELDDLAWQRNRSADDVQYPWRVLLADGDAPAGVQLALQAATEEQMIFGVNASPIRSPDGGLRGAVVTFDDLTELERRNSDLEHAMGRLEQSQREIKRQNMDLQVLATRDPLTGCLNRRSLFEGMETLMRQCVEDNEPLSCIMADIDHFKSVNDRFGHATGDKVIKLMAQTLVDTVRTEDLVGRYGGEEFCVVLPGIDEQQAAEIAERMRISVHDGKSSALRISASFGVATDSGGKLASGALVDLADKALYNAKTTGRNRVIRWSLIEDETEDESTLKPSIPGVDEDQQQEGLIKAEVAGSPQIDELQARVDELEARLLLASDDDKSIEPYGDETPSRIVVLDRIQQAVQRGQRFGTGLAVFSIEIETVRLIQNTLGTSSADKLQRIISQKLKQLFRSTDTVSTQDASQMGLSLARAGNGEFVVLLADLHDAEAATWIAPRLLKSLSETISIDGNDVSLDSRIGVSLFPGDAQDAETLLANAAAAAHEAKLIAGRDVCLYFNKEMNLRAKEQLYIEGQLHHAIERDELFLEYQPCVDLQSGKIKGFETLLRWKHPKMGVVRPDKFIPVSEHAGVINKIGDWVLKSALLQLKEWHAAGFDELTIAVNFSAVQFRDTRIAERILDALNTYEISPQALTVEITETALIEHLDTAIAIVTCLKDAGVKVALDDFGTGYSSLGYLKQFAIDVVKIDRSFLQDFPSHPHDTEIVAAIIAMAHSLSLRVVAEGVEQECQLKALLNMGCDEVQGYLLGKSMHRERATTLLANPSDIRRLMWSVASAETGAVQGVKTASLVAGVLNSPPPRGAA